LKCIKFQGSYDIIVGASPFLTLTDSTYSTNIECVHIPNKCKKKYAEVLQLPLEVFDC
jgi:hypothetical protein